MRTFLIFVSVFVTYCSSWDQIRPPSFQNIFPDIDKGKVWTLTFHVNHQNSTENAKKVLNKWLNKVWEDPSKVQILTTTPEAPTTTNEVEISTRKSKTVNGDYLGELMHCYYPLDPADIREWDHFWEEERKKTTPTPWKADKELTRKKALDFLDHREALKMYIRYIFRVGQLQKLITREEAVKIRDIFWKSDRLCENDFTCTEDLFLKEVTYYHKWRKPGAEIHDTFLVYSDQWSSFPLIAEKLKWKLE